MSISNLEPRHLWGIFDEIRQIPRPSKHEEKIREWLLGWAKEHGFESKTDSVGNVVISVPGSPGHENAPATVLQGHMDMVCEKNNDVEFDFMNDPIQLRLEGDWLYAQGTTLGSDNGVGVAAGMALAVDDSVVHGPLEILVTVDEETGLTGAAELDGSMLTGKRLLNLDTEEIGALYIGCAGGGDSNCSLPVRNTSVPAGAAAFRLKVSGLKGGHSGMDIVLGRGNAIKTLARMLWNAGREHKLNLARFDGGGVHNAIPREATADVVVAQAGDMDAVASIVNRVADEVRAELGHVDPGLTVEIKPLDKAPAEMMDDATTKNALNMILSIPHGVDAMSIDVPGLVETSNNLASVWTKDGKVIVGTSSRSSIGSALQSVRDRIRAAAELAGATVEEDNAYPGWKPNMDSEVLAVAKRVWKDLHGEQPEVKAIHAGLECGIIGEKCPGMDMVSLGPTIEAPHSPDERINVPSVETFWTYLKAIIKELA
jgi:dipeptidase D